MGNDQFGTGHQSQQLHSGRGTYVLHEFLGGLQKDFSAGIARKVAFFLFQEEVVLHTLRTFIGPVEGADLPAAFDFLRASCGLACELIEAHSVARIDTRAIAFRVPLPDPQAVLLHAMWQQETEWRHSSPDALSWQQIDHLRMVVRGYLAAFGQRLLTEQGALPLLLPPAYVTYLGPVVVRWNNTSCRTFCPFCSGDFKPACGMWAFLCNLGGFPICFDCWYKGPRIAPLTDAKTTTAKPGHRHVFEPDDSQCHSGNCTACGAHWTHRDGWWRQDEEGKWCRERGETIPFS